MTADAIFSHICQKESFLCVGLDPDISRFPGSVINTGDPVYEFNRRIIDATNEYAVAYKPNIAFYESLGPDGWVSLGKTVSYIRENYPGVFLIADAKRGDIGNTSKRYAAAFFEKMDFDAITVAPYMGADSVLPFLEYREKWTVLLALTSNPGSRDFQLVSSGDDTFMFERVLREASSWDASGNLMFVVGATQPEMFRRVREIVPHHFLLVPGIGAQGGSLEAVAAGGLNSKCGLLVNSSRAIIHADESDNFSYVAAERARQIQNEMAGLLKKYNII